MGLPAAFYSNAASNRPALRARFSARGRSPLAIACLACAKKVRASSRVFWSFAERCAPLNCAKRFSMSCSKSTNWRRSSVSWAVLWRGSRAGTSAGGVSGFSGAGASSGSAGVSGRGVRRGRRGGVGSGVWGAGVSSGSGGGGGSSITKSCGFVVEGAAGGAGAGAGA